MNVQQYILLLGLAVLNLTGLWLTTYFGLLIFLDTLMTASAAMYFGATKGPFIGAMAGAIVGGVTNTSDK